MIVVLNSGTPNEDFMHILKIKLILIGIHLIGQFINYHLVKYVNAMYIQPMMIMLMHVIHVLLMNGNEITHQESIISSKDADQPNSLFRRYASQHDSKIKQQQLLGIRSVTSHTSDTTKPSSPQSPPSVTVKPSKHSPNKQAHTVSQPSEPSSPSTLQSQLCVDHSTNADNSRTPQSIPSVPASNVLPPLSTGARTHPSSNTNNINVQSTNLFNENHNENKRADYQLDDEQKHSTTPTNDDTNFYENGTEYLPLQYYDRLLNMMHFSNYTAPDYGKNLPPLGGAKLIRLLRGANLPRSGGNFAPKSCLT